MEHLRATVRTLKTQLRDERELIKQLIMCGAWHYNPAKGSGIVACLQARNPESYGTKGALVAPTLSQASGNLNANSTNHGSTSSGNNSPHAFESVPAIQKTNCDQHYGSCNNTVLSREAYQEISQGSCDQPQLLPDDLTACEPTVVELSFSDDLDALFTNTSIQSNAYDDAH